MKNPPKCSSYSLPDWLRERLSDGHRFLLLCLLVGTLCGGAALLLHQGIHFLFSKLWNQASTLPFPGFVALMLLAPTFGGLLSGYLMRRFAPRVAGSGLPQTKEAYYNHSGEVSFKDAIWRLILSTLYIGSGNSLGREGPTVHLSAGIASKVARWAINDPARRQAMLPVGMAAGIAAAFNAPLSAITFVFEELLDNFSTKALGGIIIAVVAADAISRSVHGDSPVLQVHFSHFSLSPWMIVALPLGITAGFLGHVFVGCLLKTRLKFKQSRLPEWTRPGIGGFSCGILGLIAWFLTDLLGQAQGSIFSIGYSSIHLAFEEQLLLGTLAILLIFKFLAVVINYGSGGPGGLFAPSLYLGAMLGGIVGALFIGLDQALKLDFTSEQEIMGGCVLLGMGAMFGSVIRCPFTSLLIIFELTGNYSLILPLMAGNMISWAIANRLRPIPLYDALLRQDCISLRRLPSYRNTQDYRNLPVSSIMSYQITSLHVAQTLGQALRYLHEIDTKFHAYPVVNDLQELAGMVTHRELEKHDSSALVVDLVLEQEVTYILPQTSIREAAQLMIQKRFQQLPVADPSNEKHLIGIVTMNDIARFQNASEES